MPDLTPAAPPQGTAQPQGAVRAPTTHVIAGAFTDVGAVRSENQDCYGALPAGVVPASRTDPAPGAVAQPVLFVVADGMGGHEAGGEASAVAVRTLLAHVGAGSRDGDASSLLAGAVCAANDAVWARANADGHVRRMGTTCTVLLLAGGRATIGHVGDSRAYRVRDGAIEQITTDHTVAEAAKTRPDLKEVALARKHHLTRALGVQAEVQVDAFDAGPALPGDRFLLCSDGLDPIPTADLLKAMQGDSAQETAGWLVTLASARGSRDNATAVVVHVLPDL